jgi:protein involved in plasmid replication-relaxation
MLRCTERDKNLIVKCSFCRWLTTRQIQRLYFPRATVNAVQKRLRKLAEAGYLRTHREDAFGEALHAAGPKGRVVFEEKGLEYVGATEVPRQIPHLVGINDIRISVETGMMPVAYFFAHWQLSAVGWMHPVIPDAVFAVQVPGRRNFAVEYDRATESLSVLVGKLRTYQEGLPGFPFEAVVIVTERDRRMDSLGREIRHRGASLRVLIATLGELQANSIVDCSFLELGSGGRRKLLEPSSPVVNLSSETLLP